MKDKPVVFEVFMDKDHKWRWHTKHSNGRVTADSGQSYSSKVNAVASVRNFCLAIRGKTQIAFGLNAHPEDFK